MLLSYQQRVVYQREREKRHFINQRSKDTKKPSVFCCNRYKYFAFAYSHDFLTIRQLQNKLMHPKENLSAILFKRKAAGLLWKGKVLQILKILKIAIFWMCKYLGTGFWVS